MEAFESRQLFRENPTGGQTNHNLQSLLLQLPTDSKTSRQS